MGLALKFRDVAEVELAIVFAFFRQDDCAGFWKLGDEALASFGAQDAESGRKSVCERSVGREDRGLNAIRQPKTRSRIDNVRVAHTANFNRLFRVARSRDAAVVKDHRSLNAVIPLVDSSDPDFPARLVWGRVANGEITAGSDHRAANTEAVHDAQRLVRGVPLRNAPKVEPHIRNEQSCGMMASIEPEIAPANSSSSLGQFRRVREGLAFA